LCRTFLPCVQESRTPLGQTLFEISFVTRKLCRKDDVRGSGSRYSFAP
jgi:hypothetical protein